MRLLRALVLPLVAAVLLAATLTAAPAQAASAYPITKQGMPRNGNAMAVQYLLTARGYATTADGDFGAGTATNVKSFQSAQGLGADGIVGNDTWTALVVPVAQGSTNINANKAAQTQLNKYGANLVVDGAFGAGTRASVVAFQNSRGSRRTARSTPRRGASWSASARPTTRRSATSPAARRRPA